jgi:solute carrier family 15 (peptide/histidine transporter), member 3/4
MRSACQSLNLLTTTLGYIVGGSLNSIFSFWVTSDLNDGKLEYIFYIIAALVALSGGIFLIISRQFVYSADEPSSDVVADY